MGVVHDFACRAGQQRHWGSHGTDHDCSPPVAQGPAGLRAASPKWRLQSPWRAVLLALPAPWQPSPARDGAMLGAGASCAAVSSRHGQPPKLHGTRNMRVRLRLSETSVVVVVVVVVVCVLVLVCVGGRGGEGAGERERGGRGGVVVVVVRMIKETRVSVHARTYVQLIQRPTLIASAARWLTTSETLSCKSLVSDKLTNQPLCEEKGKVAGHPQSLTAPYPGVGRSPKETRARLTAELFPVMRKRFAGRSFTGSLSRK